MSWVETLYECWNILKNELLKENIDSIEKFMSYLFSDLFPILNKEKKIDNYDDLNKSEEKLESIIQKTIKKYKEDINNSNLFKKKNNEDKTSFISLLREMYTSLEYKKEDYPFYEYFYYTDYLNEKYINEKLEHMDETKYPVLKKFLESNNNQANNNNYSLDNLNIFNSALNLINEHYSNKISGEFAEKQKLKDEEIYVNNKDLIDKFIKLFNNLKRKEDGVEKLSIENHLCDFLLYDDNKYAINYKEIYKNFAKEQNEKLEPLLDNKIEKGIFDNNCKNRINIQQIDEEEILTLHFPKKVSFIEILFNSSYRKIIDSQTRSNESYKEYVINYDLIEENMTDILLKNKKLLNVDITEFVFNNEVFGNQVTDLITLFRKRYNTKNISIYDKVAIYQFSDDNKGGSKLCQDMINDFTTLIKYLNERRKEKTEKEKIETEDTEKETTDKTKENNKDNDIDITEETKIEVVVNKLKDNFSNNFIKIFENNDSLTIDKTSEIFLYYLKLIFELVKKELKDYQTKLDEQSEEVVKNYYQKEHPITKKDFACAIRLFTTLVLFLEKDKDNKINSNGNNLVNYLKAPDLWSNDIYSNNDFIKYLSELKLINAKISQILSLYETLGKDIEDNFCDEVKEQIAKDEEAKNKKTIVEEPNINNDDGGQNNDNNDDDDDEDMFAGKSEDEDDGDVD